MKKNEHQFHLAAKSCSRVISTESTDSRLDFVERALFDEVVKKSEQLKVALQERSSELTTANLLLRRALGDRQRQADALKESESWVQAQVEERTAELAERNLWLEQELANRTISEQEILSLAHHDEVTGLPTRLLLHDRLSLALARSSRNSTQLAFICLDLGSIEESRLDPLSDKLFPQVARRLVACVRASDTVGRVSAAEFAIVLPEVEEAGAVSYVAEKLVGALSAPFVIECDEFNLSPSLGISLYPSDARDLDRLLKNAAIARQHAKKAGRSYHFFLNP